MRMTAYLLSAAATVALAAPALRSRTTTPAGAGDAVAGHRERRGRRPAMPRPTPTRRRRRRRRGDRRTDQRRRHRRHRDPPLRARCPTCRSRSRAVGQEALQNSGAQRHPLSSTSSRRRCWSPRPATKPNALGAYPRHRHGRRQSRPRKLGRGVHRRRLSQPHRRRPQRTRRDRARRGAARAAGHAVRPQRLGRPDQHHHHARPSSTFGGNGEATYGNYDNVRVAGGAHRAADRRQARVPRRRRLHEARRLLRQRHAASGSEADVNDRDRYFVRGQLLFKPTDDFSFRLIGDYTRRNEKLLRRGLLQPVRDDRSDAERAGVRRSRDRQHRWRGRNYAEQPHRRHPASPGRGLPPTGNTPIRSTAGRGHAGPHLSEHHQGLWRVGPARLGSRRRDADLDHRLSRVQVGQRGRHRLRQCRHHLPCRRRQRVPPVPDLHAGSSAAGLAVRRQARLAGRRLLFEREAEARRQRRSSARNMARSPRAAWSRRSSPRAALQEPAEPGCLSTDRPRGTVRGASGAQALRQLRRAAPPILAARPALARSTTSAISGSVYRQDSENYAFFTHNIFNMTDTLSLTLRPALHAREARISRANFNNNNTVCPAQQAALSPLLAQPGGAGRARRSSAASSR